MTDTLASSRAAPSCRSAGLPVYLDYAATPVDPRVARKIPVHMIEKFGNPASSSHAFGIEAASAVLRARAQVAALIGAAHANRTKGRHLVTVATEHKAVLDTMRRLESEG